MTIIDNYWGKQHLSFDMISFSSDTDIIEYFLKHSIYNEGTQMYCINYPPNTYVPLQAETQDDLYEKFLDLLAVEYDLSDHKHDEENCEACEHKTYCPQNK